jgi:hypothetical protein
VRSTLFYLPHEWMGIPWTGWGWLLAIWTVLGLIAGWLAFRRQGMAKALTEGLPGWLLVAGVILWLLPRMETYLEDGSAEGRWLGIPVRGYGLMLTTGVLSALAICSHRSRRLGLTPDSLYSLALWTCAGGIAGARIFYVVQKWSLLPGESWREKLWTAIQFTEGGLVVYGAVMGGPRHPRSGSSRISAGAGVWKDRMSASRLLFRWSLPCPLASAYRLPRWFRALSFPSARRSSLRAATGTRKIFWFPSDLGGGTWQLGSRAGDSFGTTGRRPRTDRFLAACRPRSRRPAAHRRKIADRRAALSDSPGIAPPAQSATSSRSALRKPQCPFPDSAAISGVVMAPTRWCHPRVRPDSLWTSAHPGGSDSRR